MNQPPTVERTEQSVALKNSEQEPREEPRIYVASLADYDVGRRHGAWISANQEADDILDAVIDMLKKSKEPDAKGIAISDYEGFGPLNLSESESWETVSLLGCNIAKHGPAFAHWAQYLGEGQWDRLAEFGQHYLGHWPSVTEIAERFLEDKGLDLKSVIPACWQPYVTCDMDAFARDLCAGLHIVDADNGVYVFQPIERAQSQR